MKIENELQLIKFISKKLKPKNKSVLVGIGDDAAVVKFGKKKIVLTTDTLIEKDHFHLEWSTAEQIGVKAMETNVSDMAAMGAKPKYALLSIALSKKINFEFVEQLFSGLKKSARKHGIEIVGGDFTHSNRIYISIFLVGEPFQKRFPLRSNARVGDLIYCTGKLGASTAGLEILKKNKKLRKRFSFVVRKHIQPRSRLDVACFLVRNGVHAMEDVSDGLASEVFNICKASKCGAIIFEEKIPIAKETLKAAAFLKKNALDFALFGGEDFELVFTAPKKNAKKFEKKFYLIGEIIKVKKIFLEKNGKKKLLKRRGFDHFKK